MSERTEYQLGDRSIPIIPYDLFEAANLFLATGRRQEEVLPLIELAPSEWEALRKAYQWLPTSLDVYRQGYFGDLDDASLARLLMPPRWFLKEDVEPNLRSVTWHIRKAVRQNPHIGVFAERGWPCTLIGIDAEASLCAYTHDGVTVYFNGRALTDQKGQVIPADAPSFQLIGGRWMRDRNHIYGQGRQGSRNTAYWYIVEGADRETFEALNLRYARDRNCAYYITRKTVRTKSPADFRIVPDIRLNHRDLTCDFLSEESVIARDRDAVYFYGARLKGANPDGFRNLGNGYAKNREHVWYLDEKILIDGAEVATFTVPGPGEPHVIHPRRSGHPATDRLRPYLSGIPLDPESVFDDWRAYFEAKPDLTDWWWHRLAANTK
ncbi:DKNYY domain-containing protein [Oryzifoliimicrobium ureilyticus]|uniref:DKNYY domain-containing protein n=1 Tax=Oryzifoliimicrobium ureilyticus TaxID=3113724 RepID=UPI0030762F9F